MRTQRLGRRIAADIEKRAAGPLDFDAPPSGWRCNVKIECRDKGTGALVWAAAGPNALTNRGRARIVNCATSSSNFQGFAELRLYSGSSGTGTRRQTGGSITATPPGGGSSAAATSTFAADFDTASSAFTVGSVAVYDSTGLLAYSALSGLTRTDGGGSTFPTTKATNHVWAVTWSLTASVTGDVDSARRLSSARTWAYWCTSADSMQTGGRAWTIYSIRSGAFTSQTFAFRTPSVSVTVTGLTSSTAVVTVRATTSCNVAGTYTTFELRRANSAVWSAGTNQTFTNGQAITIEITFTVT